MSERTIETPMMKLLELRSQVPPGEGKRYAVERFTVEEQSLGRVHYALHGRDVPPGTYTRLVDKEATWDKVVMSDTPAELRDLTDYWLQLQSLSARSVLIHGLGLGLCVEAALSLEHIDRVEVVELDPEIIALVAPHLTDPRLTVYRGDALEHRFPPGRRWDVAWHDIWPTICTDHLPEMRRLCRRYGTRTRWQGCWGRDLL